MAPDTSDGAAVANSGIPYEIHPRPIPGQPPPPPHVYEAPDDLFDWAKIRRYVVFSLGSVRRRFGLFMAIAGSMILFAATALWALPKTYEVECRLLAQKNPVLAVKADQSQSTDPTRAAAEIIVRHENLHALIRQTDLVTEWPKHRAPILQLKDWVTAKMGSTPKPEDLMNGLTGLLEKQLNVYATPDGTVVIGLRWPDDRVMAYRLVDAAEQNFLEMRHVLEVSTIAEQISILEGHAANLKKDIMKQVEQLQQSQQRSAKEPRVARPPPPKALDAEVVNLRVMLDAKRRALSDLEEYRRRHLLELQTRLAEQRAVYSENHPAIMDLAQSIESLRRESPQLIALRQEEGDLRQQLARVSDGSEAGSSAALAIPPDLFRDRGEDSTVEYERAQLRFAVQQHAHLRERIDAGRIDLDTARAAFKYRYSVVVPAQIPRGPIKPKASLVMFASLVAGILLALFGTTAADLRTGLVLEQWQLNELLGASKAIVSVRLHWPLASGQPPRSR
jgi:hypothetical protein